MCQILYVVRDTVDHAKQHEIRQPPYIQPDARDAVRNSIDFLSGVRSFTSYVTLLITPRNVTDNSHRFYGQVLVALYSTAFDLLSCARFFTSIDFLSGVRSFTSYVTLLITPRNVTDNSHRFYGQVLVALYSTAFDLLSCARFFTSYVTLWITTSNMKYDSRHIQPDARDAVRNSIDFLSGVRSFTSYVTLLITPRNVTDNSHRFYGQVLVALYSTAFDLLSCARFFTSDFLSGVRSFTSYVTLLITPRNVTDNSHRFYGQVLVALYSTAFDLLSCARFFTSYVTLWITTKQHEIRQPPYIQPDARDAVRNSIDFLSGVRSFTSYVTLLITPRNVTDNSHRFYGQVLVALYSTAFDLLSCARFFTSIDFLSGVRSFTSYVTLLITPRNVTDNSHRFYGQVLVALYSTAFDLLSCQILYVVRDTVDHAKQHEIRQPPYIQPDARDAVRNSSDFLSGVRSFTSYVTLLITPRNVTDNSHRFYGQVVVALYSTAFDLLSCARFFTSIDFLSGVRSFTAYVTLLITPSSVTDNSHRFFGQVLVALYSTAFDLLSCARFFTSDFLSGVRSFTSYVTLLITPSNVTDNSHRFYGHVLVALYSTAFDLLSCARFFTSIDFLSGVRSFTSYVTLVITPRNVTDNSHRFYGQVLVALYSTAFDLLSCARFFTSDFLSGVRSFTSYVTLLITRRNVTDNSHRFYGQVLVALYSTAFDLLSCARFFTSDFLSGVRSFTSYVTLLIMPRNVTNNSHRFYGQVLVALYSTAFDLLSCARFFTSCQILHIIRDAVDHAKKRDRQQSSFLRPGACGSLNLPSKKGARQPYTEVEVARMLHFVRGQKREDGEVPQSDWKIAAANNVTSHSAVSMDSHYTKNLRGLTPDQREKRMADAAVVLRATMPPGNEVVQEIDSESDIEGDSGVDDCVDLVAITCDAEAYGVVSRICRGTGHDKLAVAHALYFYSGCAKTLLLS
ncbi:hypothetical protein GN244_ATG20186 [Phytophthora infestans]|uniref:Uncharacterized protein n=1 Tax=Phytophthora infestans TaxID=4787 RepID=A0A833RXT9_PHYIN|nr:hypothetical protein GN244_ATG20186 [Phytophthora infestans]